MEKETSYSERITVLDGLAMSPTHLERTSTLETQFSRVEGFLKTQATVVSIIGVAVLILLIPTLVHFNNRIVELGNDISKIKQSAKDHGSEIVAHDPKIDQLQKQVDDLRDLLAQRGPVDAQFRRKQFDSMKQQVTEALADRKPGNPNEAEKRLRTVANVLQSEYLPSDVANDGVSTMVHIAAFGYFSEAYPKIGDRAILRNIRIKGFGEGIHIDENSSVVVFGGEILDGGIQDLARAYWIHTSFENVKIIYHGGPIFLADVTFKNCTFDFGKDKPSQELRRALLQQQRQGLSSSVLLAGNFSSLELPHR